MKIALLGSRGIPARYSGVETCVENLSTRLAARGHDVTVYCRSHMAEGRDTTYHGVRLVTLPTIRNKFLDTFAHTLLCTVHMVLGRDRGRPDAALYFIAGNSPFVGLARLGRIPTVMNVDGLDSQRAKWGRNARRYLRLAEWLSSILPNRTVTDSRIVQQLYRERFGRPSTFIAYGAELPPSPGTAYLDSFGLQSRGYILMVGRLVPENGAHVLIDAYRQLETNLPLVIVGDAPYEDTYVASLRTSAAPKVVFTGYVFGAGYHQLLRHARLFVLASEVGGTHPVLIEAMAAGLPIVVNDHAPNMETLGAAGLSYDGREGAPGLARMMRRALDDTPLSDDLGAQARTRAQTLYSWDAVADAYERLCIDVARGRGARPVAEARHDTPADAI